MVGARLRRYVFYPFISLIFAGCSSVATRQQYYDPITADLEHQQFHQAVHKIEQAGAAGKYAGKDRLIYYLDSGIANHYADNFAASNDKLTMAENAAEELFTRSISRAALSLLINDNLLEYAGEDYEVLYSNLIMALNHLALDKFDDAFVEIRRANEKLELLEQKYAGATDRLSQSPPDDTLKVNARLKYDVEKIRFTNDAFARYLSMHMYAADGRADDALIDYNLLLDAFESQPHIYDFDTPDLFFELGPGKAMVSVIGLVGLAPVKEALNLRIRTDRELDLIQVLYTDGEFKDAEYDHLAFPVDIDFYFKFSMPKLVIRPSVISRIRVLSNDIFLGELQLIENISRVAEETFKAKKSLIYFRSLARSIVKGLVTLRLKLEIDQETEGLGEWLAKALVDVGSDITENADLRCARLLPGKIYVGDFELEPGRYDITVEFLNYAGTIIGREQIHDYLVKPVGWNMIEVKMLK